MNKPSSREKKIIILVLILLGGALYMFNGSSYMKSFNKQRIEQKRVNIMKESSINEKDLSIAYQEKANFCLIKEDCSPSRCCGTCEPGNIFYKHFSEGNIYIDTQNCNTVVSCVSNQCVAVECNFLLCGLERLIN